MYKKKMVASEMEDVSHSGLILRMASDRGHHLPGILYRENPRGQESRCHYCSDFNDRLGSRPRIDLISMCFIEYGDQSSYL
jgi:hypothetical protein